MNSKLRDILNNLVNRTYGLHSVQIKEVPRAEKAIRKAVGEEMLELLPTDENVTTKYGYHRDEKKYGYRLAIVDVKEVIKQWQRGEDEDIS